MAYDSVKFIKKYPTFNKVYTFEKSFLREQYIELFNKNILNKKVIIQRLDDFIKYLKEKKSLNFNKPALISLLTEIETYKATFEKIYRRTQPKVVFFVENIYVRLCSLL